jgi:hypothetical protein
MFDNAMAVFKLLEKSNCRKCGAPTCLAFAAQVFKGQRSIDDCPRLSPDVLAVYGGKRNQRLNPARELEAALAPLRKQLSGLDLASAAERLGGRFSSGRLTLKCLGKDVSIDSRGQFYTDIHVHEWIAVPLLTYIIEAAGVPVSGNWVSFRELSGAKAWYALFRQRCETSLKQIADTYTDLFEDLIHLFSGRQVQNHYESDISLVLHPLPNVPMLICYWKPDEAIGSDLNLFFDSTADKNLPVESIYSLCAGLVRMFEKLSLRHGVLPTP